MKHGLERLGQLLDRHVVGHDEAKSALLLALVCREHIYLEGPPGSAKTRMAELAARGAGLGFFFYQMHRDTRLAELVGDVVLERRPLAAGSGERIHQAIEPGGILTADVCVLDDISRAPGEALNVLLRVLNERKFGERPIPLLCAIATSNPLRDEYYNEPLDPANLDRFALQLKVSGLIQSGDRAQARELVDRFADGSVQEQPEPQAVLSRAELDAAHAELARIEVPAAEKDRLVEFLRRLVVDYDCDETNSLLTDRSFLVKAVKLLRGRAFLAGRARVERGDLAVLSQMTTFRVPEEVQLKVPELIGEITA
ncbi:MAG TPA: MoxR family ATPase [Myxococcota bacterium]|nr:MoxR family ATPase [Myxococcota bacterium]